jgi:hypothetical protein
MYMFRCDRVKPRNGDNIRSLFNGVDVRIGKEFQRYLRPRPRSG